MWRAEVNNWQKISTQTATFYVDLAEKKLNETVETSKNATDKGDKLLTINITILTTILAYLSNTNFNKSYFNFSLVFMVIFLILQLYYLYSNIFLFKIGTKGEEPKHILKDDFIENFEGDEQYLNLTLQICEVYQEKINSNNKINVKRTNNLTKAIYLFLGLPISFLLALGYFLF